MVILFYISAMVAVASTMMTVTKKNPVHALLYLIVSFLSVALIFYILGAPFIAALEVIVYAGAVMVLFMFVVMMLNLGIQSVEQEKKWLSRDAWLGPVILASVLSAELLYIFLSGGVEPLEIREVPPKQTGIALFGSYVVGVELASLLLLSGLVGAWHLGRRRR